MRIRKRCSFPTGVIPLSKFGRRSLLLSVHLISAVIILNRRLGRTKGGHGMTLSTLQWTHASLSLKLTDAGQNARLKLSESGIAFKVSRN